MKSAEGIKAKNFEWISWANCKVMYFVLWSRKMFCSNKALYIRCGVVGMININC